ncbi:MAG: ATP-binding cassette domain-containing protein [Candidatus Schekmanbacteria bacterium]|nr:ATP-binding cassette domain-containing protein [Candidatus Schekmanbacteria bacterium]
MPPQDAGDEILSVVGLSKTYVTFRKSPGVIGTLRAFFRREEVLVPAVRELTMSIRRGEIVGLLGPNGAGKTTTLKMLTGLVRPSAGIAIAFGKFDTSRRSAEYLTRLGMVMGQRNQLNPDLPAADSFKLAQAIYGIPESRCQRRLDTCLALFGVTDLALTPVRKLSLGERMKMELQRWRKTTGVCRRKVGQTGRGSRVGMAGNK